MIKGNIQFVDILEYRDMNCLIFFDFFQGNKSKIAETT